MFLLFEADSAQKLMESMYIATTGIGVTISYANTVFITDDLFASIESVGEMYKKSEKHNANQLNIDKNCHRL